MIENLYKAKKVSDGAWVEGQLLISHTGSCWIVTLYDEILNVMEKYRVDEGTLCRWTGYVDKNGKKIFKNDVCMYDGSPVVVKYGEYYSKDYDCNIEGWYHISKGYPQVFQFEYLGIEVIDNIYNKDKLQAGSKAYILDTYLSDGSIKIAEAEIRQTWDNGKMTARAVDNKKEWLLYQSYLNRVVFRTREEAEKALKENENE